jgi:hypothetical protein
LLIRSLPRSYAKRDESKLGGFTAIKQVTESPQHRLHRAAQTLELKDQLRSIRIGRHTKIARARVSLTTD